MSRHWLGKTSALDYFFFFWVKSYQNAKEKQGLTQHAGISHTDWFMRFFALHTNTAGQPQNFIVEFPVQNVNPNEFWWRCSMTNMHMHVVDLFFKTFPAVIMCRLSLPCYVT